MCTFRVCQCTPSANVVSSYIPVSRIRFIEVDEEIVKDIGPGQDERFSGALTRRFLHDDFPVLWPDYDPSTLQGNQ